MAGWISETKNGVRIAVWVSPNAKKTQITGFEDDSVRVRLNAPPVDGKANETLVGFLSKTLRIPKRDVTITHGDTGRRKLVEITAGLSVDDITQAITAAVQPK